MSRPPPVSTRTYTLFPSTTLFRSALATLDWFGMVIIRIHRPRMRSVLTLLNDCDPAETCITASREAVSPCECAATLRPQRSEEHTSELQSLMRISYAVYGLKKKKENHT